MAAGFVRMVCDRLRLVNSCYHQVTCIAGLVSTIVHAVSISTLQLYRTKAKKERHNPSPKSAVSSRPPLGLRYQIKRKYYIIY
jgi:hypothetical protein